MSEVDKVNESSKETPSSEGELEKCRKERDEYLDGWKRAKAELANYKKDEAKRFEAIIRFANEALIKEAIAVLDSFDLALISSEGDADKKQQKGLYLIRQQLEDILKQQGLERIVVLVGQKFDPNFQEAIVEVESGSTPGTVVEEVEKGYLLNGKLIRPARVKIAK